MKFRRDKFTGPACLEYSWVPEGKRHVILLRPGQQEGSRTDQIPDTLKPSHVQVYRLDNNKEVSAEQWQFPPGPPHPAPVASASVEVHQLQMEAVGTVYYTDGTIATGKHPLDPMSRPCPEGHASEEDLPKGT